MGRARRSKHRKLSKVLLAVLALIAVASVGGVAPALPNNCGTPAVSVQGVPGTVTTSTCSFTYTGQRVGIYASGLGGGRMTTSQIGLARFRVEVYRGITKLAECAFLPGTFISVLGCANVFKPNAPIGATLRCRAYLYVDFNPGAQVYSWRCASLPV